MTTNKLLATIMGELFGKYVQAYPRYGSEKKGLPTTYFLTLADEPIRAPCRAEDRRLRSAARRQRLPPGRAGRARRRRHRLRAERAHRSRRRSGPRFPSEHARRSRARGIRLIALDTAEMARRRAPRPELVLRMQGVALVGVFLRVSPFAAAAGYDRERLLERGAEAPGPLLRQARHRRRSTPISS